jgi:class 3 adenylate cyclase
MMPSTAADIDAARVPTGTGRSAVSSSFSRSEVRPIWVLAGLSRKTIVSRLVFFALVLLFALVSGTCLIIATRWIDRTFAGFLVNERMVPGNVGRYEWTGTRAGLKYLDRIMAANGQPVSSMRDLEAVLTQVAPGEPVTYMVERGGQVIPIMVETMRFTWADFVMTFGITFVSGLLYLSLALAVFLLKPDTDVSWVFVVVAACLGLYSVTSFDIQTTHAGFIRLFLLVLTLLPAALVHLSLLFPTRAPIVDRYPVVQVIPYLVSLALILPMQAFYPEPAFLTPYRIAFGYLILGATSTVVSSLLAFLRTRSPLARQRAKVVLFGAALGFPLPALGHYLSLFEGFAIQINFLAIPIALFPASIGYAIGRHNLFDVDVYIRRAVGYGFMTALVGVGYFALQMGTRTVLFTTLFGEVGGTLYPILFALLVVFLFNPVNRKVRKSVDRLFFRGASDYKKTVSAMSSALASMLRIDQIVGQILRTVRGEMFVDRAGVVVFDRGAQRWRGYFAGDDDASASGAAAVESRGVEVDHDDSLLRLMQEERRLVTVYEVREDPAYRRVREAWLQRASEVGAMMVLPLLYQGEVRGLLVVGRKKSGHFYSREDVELLTTLAAQAAVAVVNAASHEEVIRYAEDLAASLRRIQMLENIKANLSKFVPTTVQTLIEASPEAPLLEKRETDVSVLFADITGYTRLSSTLELDEVNKLVERYFGAFLDEIIQCGGDVNETVGDGLMVIFQHQEPRRHAAAAVQAALAIQRRTREINDELASRFEPIEMHVGVNSGVASVGATKIEGAAGARWTYTASGSTTNVAARLAALSSGGDVILSEETLRRIGGGLPAEDLGFRELKNLPHPVHVYRIDVAQLATLSE